MKIIVNHLVKRRRPVLVFLGVVALLALPLTLAKAAMVIEDFETETPNATSFAENTLTFDVTGDLLVTEFGSFGSGLSDKFLDTLYGDGGTSGSAGSIQLTNVGYSFRLGSCDVWTSNDDGNSDTAGNVTFVGTLAAGGTASVTFYIDPTGYTGNDWIHVDFSGTVLEGQALTALEIILASNLNYVAIDNFEFEGLDPTVIKLQSIETRSNSNQIYLGILWFVMLCCAMSLVIVYRKRALFFKK